MVWLPTPAADGLKLPLATPGPEYVPPPGLPPLKGKVGELTQVALLEGQVAVGGAVTVMLKLQLAVQLLALV